MLLNFPRFELKSFAPNYDEYMGNFGMPGFVIAMVKASSETIYVTDYGNDTYHMKNAEGKSPTHSSEKIHISKRKKEVMKCFLEAVILTLNLPLLFSRFCLLQCNFFFQPFTLLSRPSIWASPIALPTLWERCTTLAPSPSPTFYSATPMNRKRNGTSLQR